VNEQVIVLFDALPAALIVRLWPSLVVAVNVFHATIPVMPWTVTGHETGPFASVAVFPETLNLKPQPSAEVNCRSAPVPGTNVIEYVRDALCVPMGAEQLAVSVTVAFHAAPWKFGNLLDELPPQAATRTIQIASTRCICTPTYDAPIYRVAAPVCVNGQLTPCVEAVPPAENARLWPSFEVSV
jgi:hypothetical protein